MAVLLGVLVLQGGTAHSAAGDREAARQALADAVRWEERGDLRAARVELLNAVKADARWPQARVAQGRVALALFDGEEAARALARAVALGADPAPLRPALAEALLLQGRVDDAARWLASGPVAPAQRAYAARMAARVAEARGDSAGAWRALDEAHRLAPRDPLLWVDVAWKRFRGGDQAGAIAASEQAVAVAPLNVRALELRALFVREQFGTAAALPWFERAAALAPTDLRLLREQAATLGDAGRYRAMLAVTRRMLDIDERNPDAFYLQAVMAARAGRTDLAKALIERTRGRLDDRPAMLLLQGVVAYQAGDPVLAAQRFDALAQRQPDNARVAELLARAMLKAGRPRALVQLFAPVAARGDASPYLLMLMGRAHEALGERGEAAVWLDRAARTVRRPMQPLPPQSVPAGRLVDAARLAVAAGQAKATLAEARLRAGERPGSLDARLMHGDAAMAAGAWREALAAYDGALALRRDPMLAIRAANAAIASGDGIAARERLAAQLLFDPGAREVRRRLAMLALDQRQGALATGHFKVAAGGIPDPLLQADWSEAALLAGDTEEAMRLASAAWRGQPASPVTAAALGGVMLAADRPGRAYRLFQQARATLPDNVLIEARFRQARKALQQARGE